MRGRLLIVVLLWAGCSGEEKPPKPSKPSKPAAPVAKPKPAASPSSLREWVERVGGQVHLVDGEIEAVRLADADVRDEDLERLAGLTGLRSLDLGRTDVTDAGLMKLPEFPRLRALELIGAKAVLGPGLERVGEFTELDHLHLRETGVDDDSLEHLSDLRKLEKLYLARTRVTQAGLKHLAPHVNLKTLGLSELPITDLAPLQTLTQMKMLWLGNTLVGDDTLEHLRGMVDLELLELRSTNVTDSGLEYLAHLRGLTTVLFPRGVTGKGLRRLQGLGRLRHVALWTPKPDQAAIREFRKVRPDVRVTVEGDDGGPGGDPR